MRFFILLIAGIALCTITQSCKKDYVCSCTKIYSNGTGTNVYNYSIYPYTDTKNKAEERCKANNISSADFEGSYDINCEIQ